MVVLEGDPLSVAEVVSVARDGTQVGLGSMAEAKMMASREVVEKAVADGRRVYGVSTGFGALADVNVDPKDLKVMQHAILRSHAAGVGEPLDEEIVRAMLLLRARTLSAGLSGVRTDLARMLIEFLNRRVHPVVPRQGSVGASGDLAQLAHLALPLIGEGKVVFGGKTLNAAEGLAKAGLDPLSLSYKEGVGLLNGTEGMLAIACLALNDAHHLLKTADVACAMSVEALLGTDRSYLPEVHRIRPHPGQQDSASNILKCLNGSQIVASHRESQHAVQDAYSVRCAPQVHGAARDVVAFATEVVDRELASVTDNPVVFAETGEILSTGNFHGEPLGFALDFMASALSELGSISERRTDRMLDPNHSSGLPPFLTEHAGRESGFMLAQYTQAALVSEDRILSTPATVDTIPTSGSQEDHVSMGWNAGLKLRKVVENTGLILSVEAMCAAQGMDLRAPLEGGAGARAAKGAVRELVPRLDHDRELGSDIEHLHAELIAPGILPRKVEEETGGLA